MTFKLKLLPSFRTKKFELLYIFLFPIFRRAFFIISNLSISIGNNIAYTFLSTYT